ncbi:DinB family protein [Peribacillus butanolivorans]|uniref:DinB family protein n=1 Tax=Peribacillus butanolivorans TaxID=421767 RepID=UPI0036BDEB89
MGRKFKQLKFVREITIKYVANMNDETSLFIPVGFNNNIKWNLGHIYVVQERFAFDIIGEKMTMPNHFKELFSTGTKPSETKKNKIHLQTFKFYFN